MSHASLPPDEALVRLLEELERLHSTGRPVDPADVGERLGVTPSLVADALAGLGAVAPTGGGPPPGRLGRYALVSELARGGMGVVFRARDLALGREVALKLIAAGAVSTPAQLERFRREAEATARLRHPHVVTVHEVGLVDGQAFLAMELVEDARTFDRVAPHLDWRGRVALVRDAARGLGQAHSEGITHRDVKPGNLLVGGDGRLRVSDFGLAHEAYAAELTATGTLLGTIGYLAPEQVERRRDRPPGPPADVWGLGVVLYEALTGRLPFGGATSEYLGAIVSRRRPPPMRTLAPDVPAGLEVVVERALRFEPDERHPDADALADDLDLVLAGGRPRGRRRVTVIGAAIIGAAVAVLALAGLMLTRRGSAAPSPRTSPSPQPDVEPAALTSSAPSTDEGTPEDALVQPEPWRTPDPAEDANVRLLAAWTWLAEHPAHPDAAHARGYLERVGPEAPLMRLEAAKARIRVAFEDAGTLVTFGKSGTGRWHVPAGGGATTPEVLRGGARLAGGDWLFQRGARLERVAGLDQGPVRWSVPLLAQVRTLAVAPDGATAACILADTDVVVVATATGERRRTLPGSRGATIALFLDANRLIVVDRRVNETTLWDVPAGRRLRTLPHECAALATSAPRQALVVARWESGTPGRTWLHVLEPAKLEALFSPESSPARELMSGPSVTGPVSDLLVTPDGEAIVVVPGGPTFRLLRFDLASTDLRSASAPLGGKPCSAALSPDGALCAVGYTDGSVEVWVVGAPPAR